MINNAIIIRSSVSPKKYYQDYREELRVDFWFSCAYCSMTEFEAWGIGFQIDHYYPRATHPLLVNEYGNLMYSCERCNQYKGDFYPDKQEYEAGNVILRPDFDDPREHIEIKNESLKGKTHTGIFNIEKLYLNRKQLVTLRELRKRFSEANEYIAFGIRQILGFKLDKIRPEKRYLFLRMQEEITQRKEKLDKLTVPILKDFARSPLLDDDPKKRQDLKRRREFLRDLKAITL